MVASCSSCFAVSCGILQPDWLEIVTGQGYMPVDAVPKSEWFDMSVSRIPLIRNSQPITKAYCAFWKKDNSGYYVEEFADMLKDKF